jgi:hypothetical protein
MRYFYIAMLSIAVFTSACSLPAGDGAGTALPSQQPAAGLNLIATDFVNALRQLPDTRASDTTIDLQISQRKDQFVDAMAEALRQAGYGLRWVEHEGSATLFDYRETTEPAIASAQQKTFELAVGKVEMRRSYKIDRTKRVRPLTPLYMRGIDASSVVLNDDIFTSGTEALTVPPTDSSNGSTSVQQADPLADVVPLKDTENPAPSTSTSALAAQGHRLQLPDEANPLSPLLRAPSSVNPLTMPLLKMPQVENVFALGESNFEHVLSDFSVLKEQVLTFANDSLRLGARNKLLVEQMVQRFNPKTDIFSVIGCSLGPTQVRGGNAALALGRAGRVVEALRFAGVNDQHILDEGCWAGDGSFKNLPRRGVVLSLNRRV